MLCFPTKCKINPFKAHGKRNDDYTENYFLKEEPSQWTGVGGMSDICRGLVDGHLGPEQLHFDCAIAKVSRKLIGGKKAWCLWDDKGKFLGAFSWLISSSL